MRTAYISFAASITEKSVQTLITTINEQISRRIEHLYILFASDGGDCTTGFHLSSYIESLPVQTTMHLTSRAASMGPVIFAAGRNRYALPGTTFMFHSAGFYTYGRFDMRDVKENEVRLQSIHELYAAKMMRDTKLTKPEVMELLYGPQYYDTNWALAKGVIHKVRELQIPLGATIIQPNF